jgi:signal transduction histidine kinase
MEERYARMVVDQVLNLVKTKYQEIETYRQHALEAKKQELRHITSVVGGYIASEYNNVRKGLITENEAKQKVLQNIRTFRYGRDDYIWVSNFQSVLISHPDPNLHNADFLKVVDVNGNLIVPPMVKVARENGEGFTSYCWNRLGRREPSEKLTFSRLFSPWQWVYGTGVYIDDIKEEVARRKNELIDQLREILNDIVIGKTGYMYIFDDQKNMIIHPNKALEGGNITGMIDPLTGNPSADELMAVSGQDNPVLAYQWDRLSDPGNYVYDKLGWVRFFPGFKWYIASSVYTTELHETGKSMTRQILWVTGVICVLALLVGYGFLRRIVRPIEKLSKLALKVQAGNLNVKSNIRRSDEIGILAQEFDHMVESLRGHVEMLDRKVQEKTQELSENLYRLEEANRQIMDSIEYGRTIQKSMLPDRQEMRSHMGQYFLIWKPKDLIGGDFIWFSPLVNGYRLAVMDCTGHGVPGAIMTMIAASALARAANIVTDADPALILQEMNVMVQEILNQHLKTTKSDDGLDIGLCQVDFTKKILTFAGARIGLFYIKGVDINEIKGDRESLGYKSSNPNYRFTNHCISIESKICCYMSTDGLTDQIGGKKGLPFGKKRLKYILAANQDKCLGGQETELNRVWQEYRKDAEQRDDVTVLGFVVPPEKGAGT